MGNIGEIIDVSVVIPYYKSCLTIDKTVESIINQTTIPKEIIIIDDYSDTKEDNKKLLELKKIKNLTVINSEKNNGPADARNIGMNFASAKYIAFLDSDDTWKKNKLETQFNIMEEQKAFLSGHHSSINGEKELDTDYFYRINLIKQLIKNRFPTRSVMLLNNNKYKFEKGKRYAEDFLLWTEIIADGNKSIYIKRTLANSYKEDFGDKGLTENITDIFKGIIMAYKSLKRQKRINNTTYIFLIIYQSLKYMIRSIRLFKRKLFK